MEQAENEARRARIRQVFLSHGFTVKEGQADLKPYVFEAAEALLAEFKEPAETNRTAQSARAAPVSEIKTIFRLVLCSAVGSFCLTVGLMLGKGMHVSMPLLTTACMMGAAAWFLAPFVVRWGESASLDMPLRDPSSK